MAHRRMEPKTRTGASRTRRLLLAVLPILLLALSLCTPRAAAQEEETPDLVVDPGDERLVIRGVLDGQTTSFSGNVRLTVVGSDAEELRLLADDLEHAEDETLIIDRTQVSIPSGISLSEGQPRDVRVTVGSVTRPGVYTGELTFLLPEEELAEGLVIPLEMQIDAQPEVELVTDNVSFQLVRCSGLGCGLATLLLPDSVVENERVVQLDNQTLTPVRLTDAAVVLRGGTTGDALRGSDVSVNVPHTLPANQVDAVDVTFRPNRISSDSYQGSIRFKVEDGDDPVSVSVDLDVRDGPFWPLLVAVFGIIVGRLVRGMQTPQAKLQMKLLPRYYELKADAEDVSNAEARAHLDEELRDVKGRIEAGQETEEALNQALEQLDAQIIFFASLEELEQELEDLEFDVLKEKLADDIKGARQALIEGRLERAEALRQSVEDRIEDARQDGTMGGGVAEFFSSILKRSRTSTQRLEEAGARGAPERPGGRRWGWLARLMAALSGVRAISADVRYWLIRPLLWLVLLVVLVLLGLQALYVAGEAFGANGIYDYLGIFLWGLSADVAQRTLQNLGEAVEDEG